jgi:glucosamine-6-phosphate deaminase
MIIKEINGRGQLKIVVFDPSKEVHIKEADIMADIIKENNKRNKHTVIIVAGHYYYVPFVERVNSEALDCSRLYIFQVDEYLDKNNNLLKKEGVSFEKPKWTQVSNYGVVWEKLFNKLDKKTGIKKENIIMMDPKDPESYSKKLKELGGADFADTGSFGLDGHLGYNEPPLIIDEMSNEEFKNTRCRILDLRSITLRQHGIIDQADADKYPSKVMTLGMADILETKKIILIPGVWWQADIVKQLMYGPVTHQLPVSFLNEHPDASLFISKDFALRCGIEC